MTGSSAERDSIEVDALITDRYLESLLASHARGAGVDAPEDAPPAAIARAADRLARDLLRLHPSFRFEEALALRLGEAASRMRFARVAGSEGAVVTFPAADLDPLIPGLSDDDATEGVHPGFGRPLLIGGALTSAALSIAGVYVAWRLNRPPPGPMARAVRAVARSRLS